MAKPLGHTGKAFVCALMCMCCILLGHKNCPSCSLFLPLSVRGHFGEQRERGEIRKGKEAERETHTHTQTEGDREKLVPGLIL